MCRCCTACIFFCCFGWCCKRFRRFMREGERRVDPLPPPPPPPPSPMPIANETQGKMEQGPSISPGGLLYFPIFSRWSISMPELYPLQEFRAAMVVREEWGLEEEDKLEPDASIPLESKFIKPLP
ncbi:unnamed protein product [Orchesella dallaii]|uniref:Uncharacterized protein n=1 Tax=Orchesella dallaii TaxID=48710 RepID=A0ABP1S873_9HEXA